jgi:adenylate cyclase, class 2
MAKEAEIKLRIVDLGEFRRGLKRWGARPVLGHGGRRHEMNVLFDTSQSDLAGREQLLRIRIEKGVRQRGKGRAANASRALLTFKRPIVVDPGTAEAVLQPARHKVREEIELEIASADAMSKILEGLGTRAWFRYEKFRTTYRLRPSEAWAKGLLIELDETPIGVFVELEGPPKAIDRAAKELGFGPDDYILTNYLDLYLEKCRKAGEEPGDMVFRKGHNSMK